MKPIELLQYTPTIYKKKGPLSIRMGGFSQI